MGHQNVIIMFSKKYFCLPHLLVNEQREVDTRAVVSEAFFHWSGKFIPSIFIAHFVIKGTMLLKFEFEIIKEN